MRFVDPLPAQIASMDKLTVLRLLGLLSGGTLLMRGAEVEVGVSRWAWSLLARLPERGELTSEEIGVVRELGKKAVLIGVGLCEEKTWEEGIREVEKDFDGEEHEELPGIVNENEIELDSEDEELNLEDTETDAEFTATEMLGDVGLIGPQLVGPGNTTSATDDDTNRLGASDTGLSNNENERDGYTECASEEEGELPSEDSSNDPEALAAARARILARLDQQQSDDSDTENIEDIKIQQTKDDRASALWNTKATIDMIISVAGEVYGQRDLLEFRGAWDE